MKTLNLRQIFEKLEKDNIKFDREYGYIEILEDSSVIYFEEYYEVVEEEISNILYNCSEEQIAMISRYLNYEDIFDNLMFERDIIELESNMDLEEIVWEGVDYDK